VIERVLLNGADVDLLDVFAALTIRHGRGGVDEGPISSTASLTLLNLTREIVRSFTVGDELAVLLAGDVHRFKGRITDGSVEDGELQVIAVSSLGVISRRPIGLGAWPEEPWSARVLRVFNEAGILLTWAEFGGTWADLDPGQTWAEPDVEPRLTIDVGADDPVMAARPANETTVGAYLGEIMRSNPSTVANRPDGSVLVQAFDARAGFAEIELDPDLVAFAPAWSMVDEIENEIQVEYAGGNVEAFEPDSVARFESRPQRIETGLAEIAETETLAELRVGRRAWPRWVAEPIELLELDSAIGVGSPVRIRELPEWAPAASWLGIVEGWEDQIEPSEDEGTLDWTMRLLVSDPRLSGGFGLLWLTPRLDRAWSGAGVATWNDPDTLE
jgi:hypothetical protein